MLAVGAIWRWMTYEGAVDPKMGSDEARIRRLERAGDVAGLADEIAGAKLKVVRLALSALGRVGGDGAAGHIGKTLAGEKRPAVRAAAARVIGTARIYGQVDALLTAMVEDDELSVRTTAAEAMWRILLRRLQYDAEAPREDRKTAVGVIRADWEKDKEHIIEYYELKHKGRG